MPLLFTSCSLTADKIVKGRLIRQLERATVCSCDKAPSNHWLITPASSTAHIWPIKQTAALRRIKEAWNLDWGGADGRNGEGVCHAWHFLGIICTLLHIHVGTCGKTGTRGDVHDQSNTPSRAEILQAAADRCVREGHGTMMWVLSACAAH